MTVETLKETINELDYDDRDEEMAKDFSHGGRGSHLVEMVKREIAEGKASPMQEGFAHVSVRSDG